MTSLGGRDGRPSARALSALALVTACTLAYQVVFTRMLSSVLAYHFSFLAISLALLGTGAGALLVYLRPELFDRHPLEGTLARWSALYGVLLIATPLLLVDLDYSIADGSRSGSPSTSPWPACWPRRRRPSPARW